MASARPVQARPLWMSPRGFGETITNATVTYDPEGRTGGSTMRYTFESTDLSPATFLDLTSIRDFFFACHGACFVSLPRHRQNHEKSISSPRSVSIDDLLTMGDLLEETFTRDFLQALAFTSCSKG